MLRVLIIDDHPIVRRGLRQILEESGRTSVVREAATGEQGLSAVRSDEWDAVVLDLGLPDRSGLDVLSVIKSERRSLPVLILTMEAEEAYAVRVLRAGASGYLTKESAPEELMKAIEKVASGGRYVSSSLAERIAEYLGTDTSRLPHEALSEREFQVLCLMAQGNSLTGIAQSLCLSVKTVSTHRARILQKMSLHNNAELVQYALKHKLIS